MHSYSHSVDATKSTRIARLLNHSRKGNVYTRLVMVDGVPHLALVAKQVPACNTSHSITDTDDRTSPKAWSCCTTTASAILPSLPHIRGWLCRNVCIGV